MPEDDKYIPPSDSGGERQAESDTTSLSDNGNWTSNMQSSLQDVRAQKGMSTDASSILGNGDQGFQLVDSSGNKITAKGGGGSGDKGDTKDGGSGKGGGGGSGDKGDTKEPKGDAKDSDDSPDDSKGDKDNDELPRPEEDKDEQSSAEVNAGDKSEKKPPAPEAKPEANKNPDEGVKHPDGSTHWYDKDGKELRHRDANGREFAHTRDKDGKEHISEDKPITDLNFNPHVGLSPERKHMLDEQMKDLAGKYANDKKEISFEQHGKMLTELAGRKDLTEHDKLYMLGQQVNDYRNTKDGKPGNGFALTRDGANPETLNDFDPNRLRHQVIEPTNDGYHTNLAKGSWDDAVKGVINHEGAVKQLANVGRWALSPLGVEGGGFGVNKGDGVASLHQAAAIMEARKSGQFDMKIYAQEWNKRFRK